MKALRCRLFNGVCHYKESFIKGLRQAVRQRVQSYSTKNKSALLPELPCVTHGPLPIYSLSTPRWIQDSHEQSRKVCRAIVLPTSWSPSLHRTSTVWSIMSTTEHSQWSSCWQFRNIWCQCPTIHHILDFDFNNRSGALLQSVPRLSTLHIEMSALSNLELFICVPNRNFHHKPSRRTNEIPNGHLPTGLKGQCPFISCHFRTP